MTDALLELTDVTTLLPRDRELAKVVDSVSLSVGRGEIVGLVGESGSGKSMTARSVIRLLPNGAVTNGSIRLDGAEIPKDGSALAKIRGRRIAMIFQDARAHIDPFYSNGRHLTDGLVAYRGLDKAAARDEAFRLLSELGIRDPERVFDSYPAQVSGGMLQRVMIAGALSGEPELLIADEATTALDVTTQAEIVGLLRKMRTSNRSVIFITHDLELAATLCDRVVVMYAGRIVEEQRTAQLFDQPRHPYTAGLIGARPNLARRMRMTVIPGRSVSAFEAPEGCAFNPRCSFALDDCQAQAPALVDVDDVTRVACLRADEIGNLLKTEVAVDAPH